jgi:hypothetical protein
VPGCSGLGIAGEYILNVTSMYRRQCLLFLLYICVLS